MKNNTTRVFMIIFVAIAITLAFKLANKSFQSDMQEIQEKISLCLYFAKKIENTKLLQEKNNKDILYWWYWDLRISWSQLLTKYDISPKEILEKDQLNSLYVKYKKAITITEFNLKQQGYILTH